MTTSGRYVLCFLAGLMLMVPMFVMLGKAVGDTGGGPAVGGLAAGLGLAMVLSLWVDSNEPNRR